MSAFRPMSTPRPVHSRVPRNVTSTAANKGVKRRVNTGAMFSITLCLASTSQEATTTAPTAPISGGDGIEQKAKDHHQEQVEGDERVPPDVDSASGPQQGPQKRDQHGGE